MFIDIYTNTHTYHIIINMHIYTHMYMLALTNIHKNGLHI